MASTTWSTANADFEHMRPRAGNGPGWTPDRIETLTRLWNDGLAASVIAAKLGEVTRNAVIGKVHRLGLAGRNTTSRQPVPRRTSPRRDRFGPRRAAPAVLTLCAARFPAATLPARAGGGADAAAQAASR